MSRKDDEKEFRLRPRKPRGPKRGGEGAAWSIAFKMIMHHAMASRRAARSRAAGARGARAARPHFQRCAVRVTYTRNTAAGQWRAHGRYVEREAAAREGDRGLAGFNTSGQGVEIAAQLARWQAAGDERLWKLIISPEFGDRVDLPRLTRDLVGQMAGAVVCGSRPAHFARLTRSQQALFAYLDTLSKTILTCMPEPPAAARSLAVSRARERYAQMLKAVGRAMVDDALTAMQDLISHVE